MQHYAKVRNVKRGTPADDAGYDAFDFIPAGTVVLVTTSEAGDFGDGQVARVESVSRFRPDRELRQDGYHVPLRLESDPDAVSFFRVCEVSILIPAGFKAD